MQLTKHHRDVLVGKLLEATKAEDLAQTIMNKESRRTDATEADNAHFEMVHYLATCTRVTIAQALIDNEIDY